MDRVVVSIRWTIVVLSLCWPSAQGSLTLAQGTATVTPTTGVGNLGTTVTQMGNTYQITGGSRPGSGANLFHSFGEFSVSTNNIANFLNDAALPTSNILGRVTGGNPSNIFGTLQTTGFGSANLFLMNPAGIVFGPTASLNVGGSATFTTADYLRLANGAQFHAIPGSQDASISSAPVAAFGFLGSNPGTITVQDGQLAVIDGHALSLVGGDITIEGVTLATDTVQPAQLSASGGQIYLASAKSPGEFAMGTLDQGLNINGQSFGTLGEVQALQNSVIDASGDGGGTVLIRSGRFIIDNSRISANNFTAPNAQLGLPPGEGIDLHVNQNVVIQNGATLETNVTENASPGVGSGGVRVRADRIEMIGVPESESFTIIQSNVLEGSTGGSSGDIKLEANSILINAAILEAATEAGGNAGNIILVARNRLAVDSAEITTNSFFGSGNAGNIELRSLHENVVIKNFSFVTSQTEETTGNTGNILVSAREGNILMADGQLFSATRGAGSGGGIEISANNLDLIGNSNITDDNLGPMQPGNIIVALSGNLTLRDGSSISPVSRSRSGAAAADFTITAKDVLITGSSRLSSETFRSGQGGTLNIFAETVRLTDGGQIRSGSTIQPVPPAPTREIPTGAGGTITIQGPAGPARSLLIDGQRSGIFTDAQGIGEGGDVNVVAQSITIQNGGTISASTSGTAASGIGGNISVVATDSVALNNGGSVSASSAGPANAGNIAINAGAQFLSQNGSVTTQASQASGGNILVQATDAIRLINSHIDTSVQGGPTTSGGNITLDPAIVTLQNSQVLAQAVQGAGGNINIVAGTFLADQTSIVSASSQFGLSGTVNIQSPLSSLSGTLATLTQRPLQAQQLLTQRCAAQISGRLSSLVVAGRDALPVEPGGWLMSPMAGMADDASAPQAHLATNQIFELSSHYQDPARDLFDQRDSPLQRGAWDRETGCGS
ncbi:MAG: filamentous hemagglutinin N-terminal domain-containing protein [Nitrospira sp.]|nr:filamentous hemagglutinin N-terminal domain-containing protein [Nitrospira sp.]